jgi:hypothetical protein
MPALETAIIHVKKISQVEVGDRLRTTVDGETVGYPSCIVQFSTFQDWKAALCQRARDLGKPLEVGFRNYGSGDRRLVFVEWAS